LEGIAQSSEALPSVVVSDVIRFRQNDVVIVLARQHREGVFDGGAGQLPVLGPVALVRFRASRADVRASGGTIDASIGRFVPITRAFATALRPKEICKVLEGVVQPRKPAFILVSDLDRCRQNVAAGHGFPRSAHERLLTFGELARPWYQPARGSTAHVSVVYPGLLVNSRGWALALRFGAGVLLIALLISPLVARIRA
jgi:hypothetical protein